MSETLFSGYDGSGLDGLWKTDGTAAGTTEIVQGETTYGGIAPSDMVSYGSLAVFVGLDADGETVLYATDGTAAGTTELPTSGFSATGGNPFALAVLPSQDRLFFSATDAAGDTGLWTTTGVGQTPTELLPAGAGAGGLAPAGTTAVNTASGPRVAFAGTDAAGDNGLWLSDGTAAGTTELTAPSFNAAGVAPFSFGTLNATRFLFSGTDAGGQQGLFVSDGTTAGTSELVSGLSASGFVQINGHIVFVGSTAGSTTFGLWTTDGTTSGTTPLAVANAGTTYGLDPQFLVSLGSIGVLTGLDAAGTDALWVTDGTGQGTTELTGIAGAGADFDPANLVAAGTLVYFDAYDATGSNDLWVTDGSVAGTREVAPVGAAGAFFQPANFAAVLPCFAAGTRIATVRGEVAVEALQPGDLVLTQDGGGDTLPVTWIGHRTVDLRRHPAPSRVRPVRVCADAFGAGLPARDLLLSPDHAVYAAGVLVPVRYLLNGTTIVQEAWPRVSYFHVELPRHAVLLAEGLPAESYLETGQRAAFANGGVNVQLHPDFTIRSRDALGCAPYVMTGPALAALRARLGQTAMEALRRGA